MTGIWNVDFTKVVPDGAAGNQAQYGIFYDDDQGNVVRLVEAEGHEVSYNPESVDTNPIGQEASGSLVRSYRVTFGKDIIIKKGAPNYEFFANWRRLRPTGDNAKLRVYLVDFRVEETGTDHNKYYTEAMDVICTVDSANETDAKITVNFSQEGDFTIGIMERTDSSKSDDPSTYTYGFTSSNLIKVTEIKTSKKAVIIPVGGQAVVAVSFSPLGCPHEFTYESNNDNCILERRRQSVVIKGRSAGSSTVTVVSTADLTVKTEIGVTVN